MKQTSQKINLVWFWFLPALCWVPVRSTCELKKVNFLHCVPFWSPFAVNRPFEFLKFHAWTWSGHCFKVYCELQKWSVTGLHLVLWKSGLDISIEKLYYSKSQSWNETTFPNFQINFFYHNFSYKITWQVDYIHTYVWYMQLVSFQTLYTKKNWENKTYFH